MKEATQKLPETILAWQLFGSTDLAGMQVTKTVSLVSRGAVSSNGGWL